MYSSVTLVRPSKPYLPCVGVAWHVCVRFSEGERIRTIPSESYPVVRQAIAWERSL